MSQKLFETPTEEVVAVVNRDGLDVVARRHRIKPSKLWRWIKNQGYVSKRLYVRRESSPVVQKR